MKSQKIIALSLVLGLSVILSACTKSGETSQKSVSDNITAGSAKGDVDTDLCKEFNADFAYSATGKPIVRVEPSQLKGVFSCRYYTDYRKDFFKDKDFTAPGGPNFNIVLDNLSVEKNKKGIEFLGASYAPEPRIPMENYIVRRTKDNSIWQVTLVINPNRFVWTDSLNGGLTDEELIIFSIRVAEKIQGKLTMEIKKNPIANAEPLPPPAADSVPAQKDVVEKFLNFIAEKKIDQALAMMDANNDTKQGWGVNFNTIKTLKIKSIEENMKDEWTAERQLFKCILEVTVTPAGEEMGWQNGTNYRWISVQKQGEAWVIHELANNP